MMLKFVLVVAVVGACLASGYPINGMLKGCYKDHAGSLWTIRGDDYATNLTKVNTAGKVVMATFDTLNPLQYQHWHAGYAFGRAMQANKDIGFPLPGTLTKAIAFYYGGLTGVRLQFFDATTHVTFASDTCADYANCNGFGGSDPHHCWRDQICCGSGAMGNFCINKTQSDQCCRWYGAATQCQKGQTCCGSGGPGASSAAFCCDKGAACCQSRSIYFMNQCCAAGTTCCSSSTSTACCTAGERCDATNGTCVKK